MTVQTGGTGTFLLGGQALKCSLPAVGMVRSGRERLAGKRSVTEEKRRKGEERGDERTPLWGYMAVKQKKKANRHSFSPLSDDSLLWVPGDGTIYKTYTYTHTSLYSCNLPRFLTDERSIRVCITF